MRIITRLVKPHIRFHKSGLIEVLSPAAKIIGLCNYDSISFVIDDNGNLYIQKDPDGIRPFSVKGNHYRFHCSNVTNNVYRLPDIKGKDLFKPSLSFRLGATENERTPIITRRIIGPDQ